VCFVVHFKGISQVQKALVERLRILEHEKSRIEREGEQQRKQYEKCLDDVAKQVVKAVLSQKVLLHFINPLSKMSLYRFLKKVTNLSQ
jgi:hypothetical protein